MFEVAEEGSASGTGPLSLGLTNPSVSMGTRKISLGGPELGAR